MFEDIKKATELMKRVYNNTMQYDEEKGYNDEKAIRTLCNKVFGDGSVTPNLAMLHDFNNIVVQIANEQAKPMIKQIIEPLVKMSSKPISTDASMYKIPERSKARLVWSATGSGVDVKRVQSGRKVYIQPAEFSAGFSYEALSNDTTVVEDFRKLVDDIADAKVRLYFDKIQELITASLASSKIPTNNQLAGSDLTLADYNKLASRIARRGGRPIFIGDTILIDYFAMQQTTATNAELLTDKVRDELRAELSPTMIGRSIAMNLVNPFTDTANSKTEFPVNIGYMIGSDAAEKPFILDEFGGMTQITEQDSQDGRIKLMIRQKAGMDLVFGEYLGYVKEDNATNVAL